MLEHHLNLFTLLSMKRSLHFSEAFVRQNSSLLNQASLKK